MVVCRLPFVHLCIAKVDMVKYPNRPKIRKKSEQQMKIERAVRASRERMKISPENITPPDRRVTSISIPRPRKIPPTYGRYGTTENATNLSVRMSYYERTVIEEAARMCGVSLSTFTRWVNIFAARELVFQESGRDRTAGWLFEVESEL